MKHIDMLVFGEDWGSHPSSTQHLMKHLISEQEILWVNSLGLRRPKMNVRDVQRLWRKLASILQSSFMEKHSIALNDEINPSIIHPCTVPWPGNKAVGLLNEKLLLKRLLPFVKSSARAPILWTSLPTAVSVIGKLGERASVYYCGDDFSALAGVDHKPIAEMENELARKCTLIVTASEKLAEKFPTEKTFVLPHGVDTNLFGTPAQRANDLPEGPVAGFYGSLADWLDQTLLIEIARTLPHWKFVLIGPIACDIKSLLNEPNIHWLGVKPHSELPRYSQHWDVSLLPFKRNQQIEACNPLKLREYMAAGSPIVTTGFPAVDAYKELITVANDASSFVKALSQIDKSPPTTAHDKQAMQLRVSSESWGNRASELKELLQHL